MEPRETLEQHLSAEVFRRWFGQATFSEKGLSVPTKFQAEWIAAHYGNLLGAAFGFDPEISVSLPPAKKGPPAQVLQLPLPFFKDAATTPNCFLRSEVFAATDRALNYVKLQPMKSAEGYKIVFTGKRLSQNQLLVWEALIRLAARHPSGGECLFTGNSFLKKELQFKGKIGQKNYDDLDADLTDLRSGTMKIYVNGSLNYNGGAVSWYVRDDETKLFKVKLDKNLLALFGKGQWSALEWEKRLKLRRYPLALWLHGFYSSHAKPFPVSVGWLQEVSGTGTTELYKFRQSLKKALAKLQEIGAVDGWEIPEKTDLVHVQRTPTLSQARALDRKHGLEGRKARSRR